jgi:hypothetical protein
LLIALSLHLQTGGAWRSGLFLLVISSLRFLPQLTLFALAESKDDFVNTLVPNLLKHVRLPLAILEYRLAPLHPHPAQISDVLSALSLLTGPLLPLEGDSPKWSRSNLVLCGHSVGAFMAASLVLSPPPASSAASSYLPSFTVPPSIRQAITGIICIDGIYDLPTLLSEYPSYSSFVDEAFPAGGAVLAAESPARWQLPEDDEREGRTRVKVLVLVLHSKEDELLSLNQPRVFLRRLKQLYGSRSGDGPEKESADAPLSGKEELDLPDNVEVDFGSVTGTHNGLLEREEVAKVIAMRLR